MEIELHELELRYRDLRVQSPEQFAQLTASLAREGQQTPVLALAEAEDRFVLVDGYARVEALMELGKDTVLAVVLEVAEVEALILSRGLDRRRGRSALEDGWLIELLVREHGLTQTLLARRMQRSVSWVSRRLALVQQLPAEAQDAVRKGIVPAHAAAKYLVPLARAKDEACRRLITALGKEPITVRQLERLYLRWKQAAPDKRGWILDHPRQAIELDAAVAPRPPVPEGDPAAPLVHDLEVIAATCRRARRRLSEGVLHELDERRQRVVRALATETRQASAPLWLLLDIQEPPPCSTKTPAPPS